MTTTFRRPMIPMMSSAFHFLRLSFLMTSTLFLSAHAFSSYNSLLSNVNRPRNQCSHSSRPNTFVAYTSTPFDVGNNNDQLWQLLDNLRQELNNVGDDSSRKDEFQRVIQSLYCESQFNIHNLEKEIEVLRQKVETSPLPMDGSSYGASSITGDNSNSKQHNNNSSGSNMDVDEISNTLLKAVFVGYQWTEEDKKRLASAHPLDRR